MVWHGRHLIWVIGESIFFFQCSLFRWTPCSVITAHKKVPLWCLGIPCFPLIRMFCGTSTLMVVRVQFATCVFALHAPVHSSCAQRRSLALHCLPYRQWIRGYGGLQLVFQNLRVF